MFIGYPCWYEVQQFDIYTTMYCLVLRTTPPEKCLRKLKYPTFRMCYIYTLLTGMSQKSRAANKYYSSASHHEQKKNPASQIKFLVVTIKQQIKLVLQRSICK